MKSLRLALLILFANLVAAGAGTVFIEAENFITPGGWKVVSGPSARSASSLGVLRGTKDAGSAATTISIKDSGRYRIWVRFASHPQNRGPFKVAAQVDGRDVGSGQFDESFEGKGPRVSDAWKSFDATLREGEVTLLISKHEGGTASVDCLLLTMEEDLVPNHLAFNAQTFVRVTVGPGYERPVYIHIFADHFRDPWYQHYSLGREGAVAGVAPGRGQMLKSGDQVWCNLTPMIYQDSGAMLHVSARHGYTEIADRLRAKFEFATAPDEKSIVRTIEADFQPAGFGIFTPPNLLSPENLALLKTSHEIAGEIGRFADSHAWPKHGKRPERFPFFVSESIGAYGLPQDAALVARERKTLDYFGFTPDRHRHINGLWFKLENSFCRPDIAKMKERADAAAQKFKEEGGDVKDIVFAELMDEPTGQPLDLMVKDSAYQEGFRAWLKKMGKTPADLLVPDWNAVKIVTREQRDAFPALYYFSQRFRTRALGDFMATQRTILEEAYGRSLPTLANFSDGAVYAGNFYMQGVDYFELLDTPDQNAIWGEDWANLSSTYQCASYNVDLMRAAARERGQIIGHHLVAHAGRKPWDIKLKATSQVARGVKILNNFAYGPSWASHEGGPYWRTHLWQAKPETWTANASIVREVGAAEDMLIEAMPARAKVALLYSSASDVWTVGANLAYGFDRMHTWLALTHAQVPVDVVSEQQVAKGMLDGYDVCYLSGPNITAAAADKLAAWVQAGGTLWMTAGAASRDEFNRPLSTLESLLPVARGECADLQKFAAAGKYLRTLGAKDTVRWGSESADVLAAKQPLVPRDRATVLARFKDETPAVVSGAAGKGRIYSVGFLPALAYIKTALDARAALEEQVKTGSLSADDAAMIERSANPWQYPAGIRELILTPVREAKIPLPIECSTSLVDAVLMPHEKGILVPLANYTNHPIDSLSLKIAVPRAIARAESAVRGSLKFRQSASRSVELSLPLESNDFVKLYFE